MSDNAPTTPDTQQARDDRLRALIVEYIGEWRERAGGSVSAADVIEDKIEAAQALLVSVQIAMHTAMSEWLTLVGPELAIATFQAVDDTNGESAIIREVGALIAGISRGMEPGEYVETDGGAAAWLARHGHGDGTTEGAGQ